MQVPPLSEERLYPKERALVDLVAAERLAGRRVLVYATHTGTRDITGRMEDFLSRHGFKRRGHEGGRRAARASRGVGGEARRGGRRRARLPPAPGADGARPGGVRDDRAGTETDYSVYTMRQASRRSWRIGQTRARAGRLHGLPEHPAGRRPQAGGAEAAKSSLAVEGELPEDGLAAYGDDGDDLMLALARKIVAGEEDAGSVESVFEQARQVAAEAEALLVDEGWQGPEPVAAVVTVGVAADDTVEDDGAPQRSLFSWVEFLADTPDEPPPPRGRRSHEAPTLSLFQWALEQEQEGALVSAGR